MKENKSTSLASGGNRAYLKPCTEVIELDVEAMLVKRSNMDGYGEFDEDEEGFPA